MISEKEKIDYLKETHFCDYNDPAIRAVAMGYKAKHPEGKELARALFYFVRNYTQYRVGNWTRRASETLAEKGGTCTNNANLFVALCRVVGIPAGYGVMEVSGPDYFGPIALPHLKKMVSKKSKHIYAYAYLGDTWIKCDPSDDEALSLNTQHLNPQSRIVEWNGVSDAVLNIHPSHILSDKGPLHDIDRMIGKRQRRILHIPVKIANLYIDFLRLHGAKILTIEDLEPQFLKWLRKRDLKSYAWYHAFRFLPYSTRADI
jgi:hypothetical protein